VIEINWNPSERQLRQFAFLALIFFGGLGVWASLAGSVGLAAGVLFGIGIALGLPGLSVPRSVRLPYVLFSLVALPIGLVVSYLVLALLFYGIMTPTGWLLRLGGRDSLSLRGSPRVQSYWERRPGRSEPERYFRQS
jgi:hypothetical protein